MWYNPAPSQCDTYAVEYEADGLNRLYASEEEVAARHAADVHRVEARRAALSAAGLPPPSVPPNPEHPDPTVEILKMFVFEDCHMFPPKMKLVAEPLTKLVPFVDIPMGDKGLSAHQVRPRLCSRAILAPLRDHANTPGHVAACDVGGVEGSGL